MGWSAGGGLCLDLCPKDPAGKEKAGSKGGRGGELHLTERQLGP